MQCQGRGKLHPYVDLAKKTVEEYAKNKKLPQFPTEIPKEMQRKAGVFVSIKKKGSLRGCMGTFIPSTKNLYEEIVKNALSAAYQDPRFPPVTVQELKDLDYTVDVLSEPEKVRDINELDHIKYGVIVKKGFLRGLLLPNIEGVNSVEEQLRIAKLKAGIEPFDSDIEIYRFTVERYK